ncbi:hypothetical protein [Vibrio coralliilyticus]|uniref:hypothetical protein n=1 Tax=Vibrio coralliilyticus TaxID=190893 RepID=UPI0017E3FCD6|nr:hypothetical protein [Vibrio coralliilyticus]NUW69561.1 hypothetical protein [Vibrio coralliilyticus]
MLRVSENKPIAGFVPCPKCQALSVVHFPKGGNRAHTPYISCHTHKTIQHKGIKEYIRDHATGSLEEYAERYNVDVSQEQTNIDEHHYQVNSALLAILEPPSEPEVEDDVLSPDTVTDPIPKKPTTIDESNEVLNDDPKSDTGFPWLGIVALATMAAIIWMAAKWLVDKNQTDEPKETP